MKAAMIILGVLSLALASALAWILRPPPGDPLPSSEYRLKTGQTVVEFNSLHGDRCIATQHVMTCDWRYRE